MNPYPIFFQKIAERYNCQQCLWLYGPDHTITEVGAMNIFILLDKGNGQKELVTPALDGGIILPGVTRYYGLPFFYSRLRLARIGMARRDTVRLCQLPAINLTYSSPCHEFVHFGKIWLDRA